MPTKLDNMMIKTMMSHPVLRTQHIIRIMAIFLFSTGFNIFYAAVISTFSACESDVERWRDETNDACDNKNDDDFLH